MTQRLYHFDFNFENTGKLTKKLLGGKGYGLCMMTSIGLPVPPGFVITTEQCKDYYKNGRKMNNNLMNDIREAMKCVEKKTGKVFGGNENPLLVSVRSGAAMSMPGMMDTILNLGINDKTVKAIAKLTNNERFAYDSYRRFVSLFGKIALGVGDELYDDAMNKMKAEKGVKLDTELNAEDLEKLAHQFIEITEKTTGKKFPTEPFEQLEYAIEAVFGSWMGKRAVDYRKEFKITEEQADGTAVCVCTMVFGNMGDDSATGVCFTRDPGTGENTFFGEYLTNAQGEDVVAGIRTPKSIPMMETDLPESYKQLLDIRAKLEGYFHEVQDFEFTIEKNKLYMLQTRNGKMNGPALVRTGVEMVKEGILTKEQALLRLNADAINQLLHKNIPASFKGPVAATGLPASPGAASGCVCFDADDAVALVEKDKNKKVILVREETKPEDIHGFFVAQGILTCRGGKTSHAAVVARGMGKPCVSGAESIHIDNVTKTAKIGDIVIKEGDVITVDGTTGRVIVGEVQLEEPQLGGDFGTILQWAKEIKKLGVFANADSPAAAKKAREFGAQGIGLCRTERMFNAADRLPIVVNMILSDSLEERKKYLDQLKPLQKGDFIGILKAMEGLPVTFRLLDPPLHEFLPSVEQLLHEIYAIKMAGKTEGLAEKEKVLKKVKELMEVNPMIGHRGIRLGTTNPEIYEMQIRAILEAIAEVIKEGVKTHAEIMIPNVTEVNELINLEKNVIIPVREELEKKYGMKIPFMYGTMVECVRAALTADKIAEKAEFFSFGTNDLTQGTFSYSREDCEQKFLPKYVESKILPANPFEILDRPGVGEVMRIAVEKGRKTRPDLIVGICGEHGGEPSSIEWCHIIGLNYVSCSTFRIPVAIVAAAQAAIKNPKK